MRRQQKLRLAGTILAILTAALAASVYSWAQGDTPIVISDGSLHVRSDVPWSQWGGSGNTKNHPHGTKSVPKVDVVLAGTPQTPVTFSAGEACTVDVTYASTHIIFRTGANGKGFTFVGFGSFRPGATANQMDHNNPNGAITHVTITKGRGPNSTTPVDSAVTGSGTTITIHFQ